MKASGAKAFDSTADIKAVFKEKFKEENKPIFIESLYRSIATKAKNNTHLVKLVIVLKCKRLYSHQNAHNENKVINPMVNNVNLYML